MLNSVILIGRLTADPEISTTASGRELTHFCIAVDRSYTSGNEKKADFINLVAWENTARFICRYFSKGNLIAIQGQLQTTQYTDKQGNKRTAVDVLVREASFCEKKQTAPAPVPAEGGVGDVGYANCSPNDFEEITDEDLPF